MSETAMRDAHERPVFVTDDGSYSGTFPTENVVRRAQTDTVRYDVYGFVGSHGDYVELRWSFETESDALEHASEIYGEWIDVSTHAGEVFEVEVHERDLDPTV